MAGLLAALISGTVFAAAITALVTVWMGRKKSLEEDRARVRSTYAEGFEWVAAYKEMPYAIRRRRAADQVGERFRLSEEMRMIQRRLSYHRAWIRAESEEVGTAYDELLKQLRAVAGQACHRAWAEPPVENDQDMNIPLDSVDLRSLVECEDQFFAAVQNDLQRRYTWGSVARRGTVLRREQEPPKISQSAANP